MQYPVHYVLEKAFTLLVELKRQDSAKSPPSTLSGLFYPPGLPSKLISSKLFRRQHWCVAVGKVQTMAYRYGFDLIGMNWVENLSWSLHGPDVAIIREEEDAMPPVFFWSSSHLDDTSDENVLAARAGSLKKLFDGALYLVHGYGFRPERLGELWDLQGEHRMGFRELTDTKSPFSLAVRAKPLSDTERHAVQEKLIAGSLYAARTDQVVRGMLNVLGTHGLTLVSLYSLRDTMKTHGMPEKEQWEVANASKADWDLFRHTANNFEVSGADARHGDLGHNAPPDPMPLERASGLILEAVRTFISRRIRAATAHLGPPR